MISSMFRAVNLAGTAVAALALSGLAAMAQQPVDLSRWVDAHEVSEWSLQKALRRECAMMRIEAITKNPGNPITFNITTDPFTRFRGAPEPFCPTMRFYGQPRAASPFSGRSAVLVGPDLVLTAAHFIPNDLNFINQSFRFVFDFQYKNGFNGVVPPQTQRISKDNVYYAAEIVAHGPTIANEPPGGFKLDFMLIRLDRPVVGDRGFMRVRREQAAPVYGDRVVTIAHPDALATKVGLDGYLWSITKTDEYNPYGTVSLMNTPTIEGSSGGMFYNVSKDVIESVTTYGGCLSVGYDGVAGCLNFGTTCGAGTLPRASGTNIQSFAEYIPAYELVVSPQETVEHTSASGTAYSSTSIVNVDLSHVATASTPVVLQILKAGSDARSSPQISLTFVPPVPGSVEQSVGPGQRGEIRVTATVAPSVPPGEYTVKFVVGDGRWGFQDVITHRFVVSPAQFAGQ